MNIKKLDLVAISCGRLVGEDSGKVDKEAADNFVRALRVEAPVQRNINTVKFEAKCVDCGWWTPVPREV